MFSQLIANALIAASIYLLVAAGINLAYSVTGFFHFAHAAVFACGAYCAYVLHTSIGLPLGISAVLAILLAGILGLILELFIYRPLRTRHSRPLVLLLASIGIYVVIQNLISMFFGDASRRIRSASVQEGLLFFSARITQVQLLGIVVALALLLALLVLLTRTRWGRILRAVMSDPELASLSGINVDSVILSVSFLASALAATAGILLSMDVNMTPTMGMPVLLAGVVAAIVGGIGTLSGAAFGVMLLALAQQFSVWSIGAQWQELATFAVLLSFLLIRPHRLVSQPSVTRV